MENLRELLLLGNPVRELEYKNNRVEKYRQCAISSDSTSSGFSYAAILARLLAAFPHSRSSTKSLSLR